MLKLKSRKKVEEIYFAVSDINKNNLIPIQYYKAPSQLEAAKQFMTFLNEEYKELKLVTAMNGRISVTPYILVEGEYQRHPTKRVVWFHVEK